MTNKEIYIIRHGQTDYNAKGIIQGSGINSSLNEVGRAQSLDFFREYQHINFEVVITSALKRTHQTVEPFLQKGIRWEQFPDIDEMNWGEHEGRESTPEMREYYKSLVADWQNGNYDRRIEGGESLQELADRMSRFVQHLRTRPEKTLLVCSHGRAMRCMMAVLRNDPLKEMERYKHSNTGLYKVRFDGTGFYFDLMNDTSHVND